jgi:hypothetical protein
VQVLVAALDLFGGHADIIAHVRLFDVVGSHGFILLLPSWRKK